MKSTFEVWTRRIGVLVGAAVAATAAVNAIRLGSWAPIAMVAWLPAVFVAVFSRPSGRCGRRRGTTSAG